MNINSLSYHLAFAILQLIKHADGNIYHRLNLTLLIKECVKAMGSNVTDIEDDIHILRDSFEPELDLSPYTYSKRAVFEIELDKVQENLLKIVNDDNLISQSVMQEIIAGKFSSDKPGQQTKPLDQKIQR